MNTVKAISLSRYICAYIQKLNHMKLQKLIYYVDAWHLVFFDAPLIFEDFEAWVHGPVVRTVWNLYKGKLPVHTEKAMKQERIQPILTAFEKKVSKEQLQLINDVLDEYGTKTSYELELCTHNELPWREARQGYEPLENSDKIISKTTMKNYYTMVLHNHDQEN
ncbi:MAG: Panacea domain-containing protein [Treponema sp.]